MDSSATTLTERSSQNGGSPARRSSLLPQSPDPGVRSPFLDNHHILQVLVHKDERGYGMKVSGDNPVYVQSVKEGGAAEKAGLQSGDKILKVNGQNVVRSTHTEVVALIRASTQVILTVQPKSSARTSMGSPGGIQGRTQSVHAKITNPQPVDDEKQYQLQLEKAQHYRLMIEKEQRHIDLLRSQLAITHDDKKFNELTKTERNLQTLQAMLQRSQNEPSELPSSPISPFSPNGNSDTPPPLPKRNQPRSSNLSLPLQNTNLFLQNEINANLNEMQVNNPLYGGISPPPLPPRQGGLLLSPSTPSSDAVNSISKQMAFPLVATCATLVDNYSAGSNPTHQRTKSSPDSLVSHSPVQDPLNNRRLTGSESLNDLTAPSEWTEGPDAPPGTPPPPYPSPTPNRRPTSMEDQNGSSFEEGVDGHSSIDASPVRNRLFGDRVSIHAAMSPTVQQSIRTMEDDEISDQDTEQPEEHGPFKSLARIWDHPPHMAVFTNYILSNADPNSLLFYLLTDLYKEGNAKEMRKWAFEIHSCFLVPGAPLHLNNVDEHIAREIDKVLTLEFDKEEILRKIFWKARSRAKEELSRQLTDFQQKRTAGLGTIFGPPDHVLLEAKKDKQKQISIYEGFLSEKLEPYLEEIEKENYDAKRYFTAAALTTVLTRVFGLRLNFPAAERCPTFVCKEKSFKNKFIGRHSRKQTILGHQYIVQQYYTVIHCNHCHQIIYGISPQGDQCSLCHINLHRHCVKLYEDACPGPINKADRGLRKFIRIRPHENSDRRKSSSNFIHMERDRRQNEEKESSFDLNESSESKPSQPVSRSGSDRRPDTVKEEIANKYHDSPVGSSPSQETGTDKSEESTHNTPESTSFSFKKKNAGNPVKRSESVNEQSEKQRKQRRNRSDPSQNTTSGQTDLDHRGFSNTPDSGSSSNSSISLNGRFSESPSNSTEVIRERSDGDSDVDSEPVEWQKLVSVEQLNKLQPHEKKRQDVINEIFHTEGSHVRFLKVLYKVFYKTLRESKVLSSEELNLVFPNIKELYELHGHFNREMRQKRNEGPIVRDIGDLLLNMFGGQMGESLQEASARFCELQQIAMEFVKDKRRKDQKFDSVVSDCEKKRQCRRLPLVGILPVEMQRLSKYPLLLERLIGAVQDHEEDKEEVAKLRKAHQLAKDLVIHVNEAAKIALNNNRLKDIQKNLDMSNFERAEHPIAHEFKPLDLTNYKLVLEGPMILKRHNKGQLAVHVLLLEEAVVILQKEGEKYSLKFFQSGHMQPLSPIIKISTLLVRNNAVSKNALFLVNTSTTSIQMYDLMTEDDSKRDIWFKHFSEVTEAHRRREGKSRPSSDPTPDSDEAELVQDFPQPRDVSERAEEVQHEDTPHTSGESGDDTAPNGVERSGGEGPVEGEDSGEVVSGGEGGVTSKITAEEWPLIQPSQVHVQIPPVHTAELRLTPLEQIRRKDEEIRRALTDKESLVADLLSIPRDDFQHIADMAAEDATSASEPMERVLAAIYQTERLQKGLNEALHVEGEVDPVLATGGRHMSCASQNNVRSTADAAPPGVSAVLVKDVASNLSTHLTELLGQLKQMEDEKQQLRNELHKLRERLHEKHQLHDVLLIDDSAEDLENGTTLQKNEEVNEKSTESAS